MEKILHQAELLEKEFDWLGAAGLHEKALKQLPPDDFLKSGCIHERLGYALYRAGFQAKDNSEFKQELHRAIMSYEKAKELYEKLTELVKTPRMLRCDAMINFMGYWLASETSERARRLNECWRLTKGALKIFEETGEAWDYGITYNQLSAVAYLSNLLEWDFQSKQQTIEEAKKCGEKAISLLSSAGESCELAKAYVNTATYTSTFGWSFIPDLEKKETHYQEAADCWKKANELSEATTLLELLASGQNLAWSFDETVTIYKKALAYARKTKDNYLIGNALDYLAYASFWKAMRTEDEENRIKLGQEAIQYAEATRRHFSIISLVSIRGGVFWTAAPECEYNWVMAQWEANVERRRDLLEEAVKTGSQAITLAKSTGVYEVIWLAHHALSIVLDSLAQIEPNLEEKRKLLERALEHRKENINLIEQTSPFTYWNLGVNRNFLAELKAELSYLEKEPEAKKRMLQEAILDKERCLQLCMKEILYFEKRGELSLFAVFGGFQYSYGKWLNRLYEITGSGELQQKAARTFEQAAESYSKVALFSRMAECHWKAARSNESLSYYMKAAENFQKASDNYNLAIEKIPQLKDFYQDHSLYMRAWAEIEKAKHNHQKQDYGNSREHYEKAATLHKSLKQWDYLAPNYFAWAQIENAENLSRQEQSEDAIQAFKKAIQLFSETQKSLQTELCKIQDTDERDMDASLIRASKQRIEYCAGRIGLEEAKILDKIGDHLSSSEKYGQVVETFERVIEGLESEQDREEFGLMLALSRALQKMTEAEAKLSPELYLEASELFNRAKDLSPNEKMRMLVFGHSRFCRALYAGTRFADTRDTAMHAEATRYLESAANYYMKAGFQNASEYAKATGLLFDAYAHIDDAKVEKDPEKKARLYIIAERVLLSSADFYMKTNHEEKREQVLKLLKSVREERELAVSLTEILHAPSIVSTSEAFVTPTPTYENAVGIDRFEHADVQANLISHQNSLEIGENLNLDLELANIGTSSALLIRIEEVVPRGFVLTKEPETYRSENSHINMKGKRLEPLRTEKLRLILKPKLRGVFPIKPRVLYLDENGSKRTYEPEPLTITVKELGISGWLKGPSS